ncbi:MAG TPA: serine/threonine-protein kinase [Bryobacteraceae bacterium]|nr:serine/threonine-protein kinase [Bryobacteraceae bacterium]
MNSDELEKARAIFNQAVDLPRSERSILLDRECGSDGKLRSHLEKLLEAHEAIGTLGSVSAKPRSSQLSFGPDEVVAHRYRIVHLLGTGGMGEVYEATDTLLQERIALKTLRAPLAESEKASARFKREVQLARRVTHPNVCRIFDFGQISGPGGTLAFLTMELLRGEPLSAFLERSGPVDPVTALAFLRQVAAALDAAHDAGIVHGDLKPANVMLVPSEPEPRVVVTDFGIARGYFELEALTATGEFMGTPGYMAPEQLAGSDRSVATDIYSLGLLAFTLITGTLPFTPADAVERVHDPDGLLRRTVAKLDRPWQRALGKALAINPADRFARAGDLVKALERATQIAPVSGARLAARLSSIRLASGLPALLAIFLIVACFVIARNDTQHLGEMLSSATHRVVIWISNLSARARLIAPVAVAFAAAILTLRWWWRRLYEFAVTLRSPGGRSSPSSTESTSDSGPGVGRAAESASVGGGGLTSKPQRTIVLDEVSAHTGSPKSTHGPNMRPPPPGFTQYFDVDDLSERSRAHLTVISCPDVFLIGMTVQIKELPSRLGEVTEGWQSRATRRFRGSTL